MTNDDPAPPDPSEPLATANPTQETTGNPKDLTRWFKTAGRKTNPSPPCQEKPPDPKLNNPSSNSFAALAQEEDDQDATMEDQEQQEDADKTTTDDTPMADIEGKHLKKTTAIVEPGSAKKQRHGRSPTAVAPVVTPSKGTPQKRASTPAKALKQTLLLQTKATKPNAEQSANSTKKPEGREKSTSSGSRSVSLQPKGVRFKEKATSRSKSRSKSNTPDSKTANKDSSTDSSANSSQTNPKHCDKNAAESHSAPVTTTFYKDAANSTDKAIKAKKKTKKNTPIQDKVDAAVAKGTDKDNEPALTTGISGIITLQATFPFPDNDTGFTDVKKAACGLLEYLLTTADTTMILHGKLGQTLSNEASTYVDLLSNLDDDEALSYLNTEGRTFSDQKQLLTVKLKFHFQSGDPHSLDDLNSRCATNLQNDSVSLLSCILNTKDTSPEARSATLHSITVHPDQTAIRTHGG
eukprot:scaffold18161_cov56-Attheya_sp.AAC.10